MDFFKKLDREKWSGEVSISSSQGNLSLMIFEGQLIWAHRPLQRAIERISKISWIEMPPESILASCKSWEDFVRILLHANQERHAQLVRHLKTDRLELFFRMFFWSNVEMKARAASIERPDPVELGFFNPRSLKTLLKEADRRAKEWPEIQKHIGSSKRTFVNLVQIPSSQKELRDLIDEAFEEGEDSVSAGLPYSPEELELLRLCDGTNSVQDLVRISLDGEFLTLRRLMNLWEKGAVAPKDDENSMPLRENSSEGFKFKDLLRISSLSFAFFIILTIIHSMPPRIPAPSSVALQQAIEIFRRTKGRYPLGLAELRSVSAFHNSSFDAFEYRLLSPTDYELVVK